MKLFYCCLLLLGVGTLAEQRAKRQASYTFPGPRTERAYRPASNAAPVYVEEQDDREVYQSPRRQFQAQPVQPQYAPTQSRAAAPVPVAPPAPAPPPVAYEQPRAAAPAPAPAPRQQSSQQVARRRASTTSSRANKYGSAPQQSLNGQDVEEPEVPDPLTLLLQDSQFTCGGKQDGYYADDSVNCQVFHYCVGGAKHSWMCPENTVFHQVHLNCVPDAQDICSQSEKFHFVNDYLYKPVDYEGPNNTARYSQRYYPDGYVVGDPLGSPQQQQAPRRPAPQQSYSAPAPPPSRPAPRPAAPPPPPPQPAYRASPQSAPAYRQSSSSRPASRPSRPVESYPAEEPQGYRAAETPQGYRAAEAPQGYRATAPSSAPASQNYRAAQAQQAARQPQPESYRAVAREPPSSSSYSSEENLYQPQSQPQARRPSAPTQHARPTASYAPPREQTYRATARSSGGYPAYSSNQAAGVQYDEDY